MSSPSKIPYPALVAAADELLESCEENVACLANMMDRLDEQIRSESARLRSPQCMAGLLLFFPGDAGGPCAGAHGS